MHACACGVRFSYVRLVPSHPQMNSNPSLPIHSTDLKCRTKRYMHASPSWKSVEGTSGRLTYEATTRRCGIALSATRVADVAGLGRIVVTANGIGHAKCARLCCSTLTANAAPSTGQTAKPHPPSRLCILPATTATRRHVQTRLLLVANAATLPLSTSGTALSIALGFLATLPSGVWLERALLRLHLRGRLGARVIDRGDRILEHARR